VFVMMVFQEMIALRIPVTQFVIQHSPAMDLIHMNVTSVMIMPT